jgi:ribosomal protein L37AE/L43A
MADGTEKDDRNPYAALFDRHRDWIAVADPRMPFPMFGFEVGPGWAGVLGKLFDDIAAIVRPTGRTLEVSQVKEKFGTLRFYWSGPFDGDDHDRICEAVELAEFRSEATCEDCGARGVMRNRGGWYSVRCDDHAERGAKKVRGTIGHISGHLGRDEYWKVDYDPDTDTVTRRRLTRAEYDELTKRGDRT